MILQCSDFDRALGSPELMPDLRAHAANCPECSRQLHLWEQISREAPGLRQEWESPYLWQRIQANLQAEAPPRRATWRRWTPAAAAAVVIVLAAAAAMVHPWRWGRTENRELLTDAAFTEVRQTEAAYVRSIDRLSELAGKDLERSSSPLAAAYREKLALLDSGIAELKAGAERNRYNAYLRTELASLYREKENTLEDWLRNANRN